MKKLKICNKTGITMLYYTEEPDTVKLRSSGAPHSQEKIEGDMNE